MHVHQLRELSIRLQVRPAADILRSATLVAAQLPRVEDRVGRVIPGMLADLLVVDGLALPTSKCRAARSACR